MGWLVSFLPRSLVLRFLWKEGEGVKSNCRSAVLSSLCQQQLTDALHAGYLR